MDVKQLQSRISELEKTVAARDKVIAELGAQLQAARAARLLYVRLNPGRNTAQERYLRGRVLAIYHAAKQIAADRAVTTDELAEAVKSHAAFAKMKKPANLKAYVRGYVRDPLLVGGFLIEGAPGETKAAGA